MARMRGVVEISSDEEDLSDVGDDAVTEDFDDAMIMSDLSSQPVLQNTAMPDDLMIMSETSSQRVLEKKAKPAGAGREEEDDDCVILADDPGKGEGEEEEGSAGDCSSDELEILAAKGPRAYRDFPHARHLCPNFPFSTTSHMKHCIKCHGYVCDTPAPCNYWADHCHATDKERSWKMLRKLFRCKSLPASGHPSIASPSHLPNEVSQKQQRHASAGVSLSLAGTVSTPRAERGTGNTQIAQNTYSRAMFKRARGVSPGIATTDADRFISAAGVTIKRLEELLARLNNIMTVATDGMSKEADRQSEESKLESANIIFKKEAV